MAAMPQPPLPSIVDLSRVSAESIELLLNEEISIWQQRFRWDFRSSADMLRRFVGARSLSGFGLQLGNELVGYTYHVFEGHKALIGDFYLRQDYVSPSSELILLNAIVQSLAMSSGIRRIESQLMMLPQVPVSALPFSRYLSRYDRLFMEASGSVASALQPASTEFRVSLVPWREKHQEEIAHLVSAAYRGHVDSEINDQYRTIPGARQFLANIIKFPGCGRFSPTASVVAIDERTGRVCGVCLGSIIAPQAGHVTQLCVLPAIRGARLGYELLRQTMVRFAELGCATVSLTVTASNVDAIRLYESVGYRSRATFPALVWEGFR